MKYYLSHRPWKEAYVAPGEGQKKVARAFFNQLVRLFPESRDQLSIEDAPALGEGVVSVYINFNDDNARESERARYICFAADKMSWDDEARKELGL